MWKWMTSALIVAVLGLAGTACESDEPAPPPQHDEPASPPGDEPASPPDDEPTSPPDDEPGSP